MPDDFESFGITIGNDCQVGIGVDDVGGIDQFVSNPACQCRRSETGAYIGRNVRNGHGSVELALTPIGQSNYRHLELTVDQ